MRALRLLILLPALSGCYASLPAPTGPRAHLILAPTEQLADEKQPPGIYVYRRVANCSGILRPAYPPPGANAERPYTIPAGQPIAIGWYSDFSGRVSMGVTPAGIVVPTGPGTSRMCTNTLTFTPVEGETYRVSDARVSQACAYELTDSAGRPVPHFNRPMWPEPRKDGSHCEPLPAAPAAP